LKNAQQAAVSATVTYDTGTQTARLQPSAALASSSTYTATVTGVTDSTGTALANSVSWSFTTAAPAPAVTATLWPSTAVPAEIDSGDAHAYELGVRFYSDSNGWITALRYYKSAANTGVHTGSLWNANGALLATATFSGESASGWQQVTLPTPVA